MNKVKIGYRIHLTFDENINLIQRLSTSSNSTFSGIDTYVKFKAPAFYLEVGNFRSKHEAELVKKKITRTQFPCPVLLNKKSKCPN